MLANLEKNALWRTRTVTDRLHDNYVNVHGVKLLNFSSNDYLGLANHPEIKQAFSIAADKYGLGSASSPLVTGYSYAHQALEEAFAEFSGRERALLFNSGYHANLAIITTFANRHTVVIADKHCHASLIDGITLSHAKHRRYQHLDLIHANTQLSHHTTKNKLLITESVFSMEGNITDVTSLSALATKHQAMLIVDDAHGIGVLGRNGKGVTEQAGLSPHDIPCLVTPLGKAPASMGAIVSGSHELIELLIQHARSYRYSTALPPAIAAATLMSLKLLESETWRREKLISLIQFFNHEASIRGLTLASSDITPIRCIMINSSQAALDIAAHLHNQGCLVFSARPPTVPNGTARLRISLNCMHNENDIIYLLDNIISHIPTI